MSNIDKQALRERYSPKPVPKCHICGEEMTIQRMSASRITYGCTGEGDDGYFKFGRTFVDEHYEESCVTVVDVSDPDVLALLDELEHYKSREERVTKLVLDNSTSWDVLYEKLEAAEKRIAEQREYYEGVIADGSKRIAELERSETQLISERDDAESALNDAYKAVMGQSPEWSNWFSFENAIDEIELACELWRNQTDDVIQFRQRIAELEAREIKPSKGEVLVTVSGFTGCGKNAIAGEIEIAMKAIGVPVQWSNGDAEKRMTRADWLTAIEMYRPTVRIVEVNVPRAAGIKVEGE
ncbi:ead/Ea22-like family protein [Salmonella enterica]|nr:ead/Ea22-like family protein [Salmonella enterica]EKN6855297.1 ead/Ea22-like family protein [Salmonella enterica]